MRPSLCLPTSLILLLAAFGLCGCGLGGGGNGIVSLAPNITETIVALGEGDRIIGVSSFDDYPPEIRDLPSVGGYIDPDLEAITKLSPAMIIVPGRHAQVTQFAEQQGISVLNVHMDNLKTIYQGIETIGMSLQVPAAAKELCATIQTDLDAIREAVAPFERRKVLIVLGRERGDLSNLQTVGGTSFISEIVEAAGGDNIYKDAKDPYLEASKETIVLSAPDAILEIHAGKSYTKNQEQALFNDWRHLNTVPAVQNGSIYFVLESHAMRPGPRIAEITKIVARKLHFLAELPE